MMSRVEDEMRSLMPGQKMLMKCSDFTTWFRQALVHKKETEGRGQHEREYWVIKMYGDWIAADGSVCLGRDDGKPSHEWYAVGCVTSEEKEVAPSKDDLEEWYMHHAVDVDLTYYQFVDQGSCKWDVEQCFLIRENVTVNWDFTKQQLYGYELYGCDFKDDASFFLTYL